MARLRLADIAMLKERLKPTPKPHLKFTMDKEAVDASPGAIWVVLSIPPVCAVLRKV
jgi:hypothetical protein